MTLRLVHYSHTQQNNPNPLYCQEQEKLIDVGFHMLRALEDIYGRVIPWAQLFQNQLDRTLIDDMVWSNLLRGKR